MAPRPNEAQDKMKVPGPGTYDSGDLNKCREKMPAYTMAPKTNLPVDKSPKPPPNAYSPEKVSLGKGRNRDENKKDLITIKRMFTRGKAI